MGEKNAGEGERPYIKRALNLPSFYPWPEPREWWVQVRDGSACTHTLPRSGVSKAKLLKPNISRAQVDAGGPTDYRVTTWGRGADKRRRPSVENLGKLVSYYYYIIE